MNVPDPQVSTTLPSSARSMVIPWGGVDPWPVTPTSAVPRPAKIIFVYSYIFERLRSEKGWGDNTNYVSNDNLCFVKVLHL